MTRIDWKETAWERSHGMRQTLRRQGGVVVSLVALMWLIELLDAFLFHGALDGWGIHPRTLDGLRGIVAAPFLHSGWGHLLANSVPFIVLGWMIVLHSRDDFWAVTGITALVSGLGVWLLGWPNTVHLGASGVIFGYLGYLLARGYYERSLRSIGLALIAFFFYGGMIWGIFPLQSCVSWLGHLFGLAGGIGAAYWQAQRRTTVPLR